MDIPHLLDASPGGGSAPAETLALACAAASGAVGRVRAEVTEAVGGLDDRAMLDRFSDVARLARDVDMVMARMSRDLERRSDDAPGGGLARRQGHRGAAGLIASAMGGTLAEAFRLMAAGRALEEADLAATAGAAAGAAPAVGIGDPGAPVAGVPAGAGVLAPMSDPVGGAGVPDGTGAPDEIGAPEVAGPPVAAPAGPPPATREPRHPHVAAALDRGEISVECASLIMTMLESLDDSVAIDRRRRAERDLVARAPGMSASAFARVVRRFKAALDVEQNRLAVERMRAARGLRVFEDREGMLVINGRLDPETGAPVRAALDALVGDAMRRSQDAVGEDTRTTDQMRADSLAQLARHALGCTATELPLSTVTVVVRVHEKDLRAGLGNAEIDGSAHPVDVGTLRRMAADADVVAAVLGGRSELLDLGRRRRLFTRAQRRALGERDGGCAFCGAPPGWTQVHHIRWWSRDSGRTDLSNGVMLCGHCHHVIHDEGWEIRATPTEIWFVPPARVDAAREPRRGGRARFHAPEWLREAAPPSDVPQRSAAPPEPGAADA